MFGEKRDVELEVHSNWGVAVEVKAWYNGNSNVVLVKNRRGRVYMDGVPAEEKIRLQDSEDEVLARFENIRSWEHKKVKKKIKKLAFTYPMTIVKVGR